LAAAPETVIPQWRTLEDQSGAFALCAGKIKKPRLEFWALRIDLAAPGLRFVVRDNALSTKVSSFVRDNDLLAGINAAPFDPASAKEGEPRTNAGVVISNGIMRSAPNPRFDALVWFADNSGPVIVPQAELAGTGAGIVNAVGGFHQILKDSALTERAQSSKPRYPRSAVGLSTEGLSTGGLSTGDISPDGHFLYLLVIDGSRFGSIGATEAETALLLRSLGAAQGLNLDGGGSSALALAYPDGAIRVLNTPVHGGIPGQERAVAACLGVGIAFSICW
jgi:hypothetical protein